MPTFSDSFRFIDAYGFEHLVSLHADTWDELTVALAGAVAEISASNGRPLISNSLSLSSASYGTMEPAPVLPPAETPEPAPAPAYVPADDLQLEPGQHVFDIMELFHDASQDGRTHTLKVVIDPAAGYSHDNGKWGIAFFANDATAGVYAGWVKWQKNHRYPPNPELTRVIVQDPKQGSKRASVVGFLP